MHNAKNEKFIDILINLEPAIKKAGDLALQLRKNIVVNKKFNTGIYGIDIVTEADLKIQELVLSGMAQTELSQCRIIAEEDTPSVSKFKNKNGLVLTLDPIDGTIFYSTNKRFFSIIVSLNDGKNILYTFNYFPALKWGYRIARNKIKNFGKPPKVNIKNGINTKKIITHWLPNPEKVSPKIYEKLTKEGYIFSKVTDVTDESGSTTLFYLNQSAGCFTNNPSAYDGLVAFHYATVAKLKIYSNIDISQPKIGDHGLYYPGWYIALR